VLSQPSWWTLQRLLILVGALVVVLAFTGIWITQLRRLVEQRTAQLQRETRERERVERQHALEAERSRIARDLHDDLGASLTEISVLASTGQRPGAGEISHPNLFHSIAGKARSLIAALDVIVWAVDPEDNSLQSLADYLTGYAEDFFSHTNISCRFKVPVTFPQITLDGRVRHDLLMVVKEAMTNVVRHAEATEVEFRMAVVDGALEIVVVDNGRGFDPVMAGDGHGLKNFSARLEKLGGRCQLESRAGGGTTVRVQLPLPAPKAG
jgi:signal transduction histidine kinase